MRNRLALTLLLLCSTSWATDILQPGQVDQLFSRTPQLVVLWSVDCPPCYKELAMIEELLQQHPALPITLIATDDDESRYAEVEQLYTNIQGSQLKKAVFADSAGDSLRYRIDRSWLGELPRSYFVNDSGERLGISGLLSKDSVIEWLIK